MHRSRVTATLGALVVATTLVLAACGSSEPEATPTDPVLARGQEVYRKNCATCHGSKGAGGSGVKLAGVVAARFPNIEDQIAVIRDGRPGMPAWGEKLSPEEIEAVARWEREGF